MNKMFVSRPHVPVCHMVTAISLVGPRHLYCSSLHTNRKWLLIDGIYGARSEQLALSEAADSFLLTDLANCHG